MEDLYDNSQVTQMEVTSLDWVDFYFLPTGIGIAVMQILLVNKPNPLLLLNISKIFKTIPVSDSWHNLEGVKSSREPWVLESWHF